MSVTDPLYPSQQIVLQSLLASLSATHTINHDEANSFFRKSKKNTQCQTIEECFLSINEKLKSQIIAKPHVASDHDCT